MHGVVGLKHAASYTEHSVERTSNDVLQLLMAMLESVQAAKSNKYGMLLMCSLLCCDIPGCGCPLKIHAKIPEGGRDDCACSQTGTLHQPVSRLHESIRQRPL